MPPLTKEQIAENLRKINKGTQLANIQFTEEQIQNASSDPQKREIHKMALKSRAFRADSDRLSKAYNNIPRFKKKFYRLAGYYMDHSGTETAEKTNLALEQQLSTEAGCRQFARRVAGDLLRMDLSDCMFFGSAEEAVQIYAANPKIAELGFAALDLINDGSGYLEPAVVSAIKDRMAVLQNTGIFTIFNDMAATECYEYLPSLTAAQADAIDSAENSVYIENAVSNAIGEGPLAADFVEYIKQRTLSDGAVSGDYPVLSNIARGLSKESKLNALMAAKDEDGKRIGFYDAFKKISQGKKISFEKVSPEEQMQIAELTGEAVLPAKMPEKRMDESKNALYSNFSEEALGAQGKGLQEECRNLYAEINKAKLWYTRGSDEYQHIGDWLKAAANSTVVPNRDQSLELMNKILGECRKYIANKEGLDLSPRKQKRLDAVNAVKESLEKRVNLLNKVRSQAKIQHMQAEINAGDMEKAFHVSEQNQKNYHTDEIERFANEYRNRVEYLKGEDGAASKLAADVRDAMEMIASFAGTSLGKKGEPYLLSAKTEEALGKMAMLELILDERRVGSGKKVVEDKFDAVAANEKAWKDTLKNFTNLASVKRFAENIVSSPEAAADFITGKGYEKLLKAVNKELIAEYGENEPEDPAPVNKPAEHAQPDRNI